MPRSDAARVDPEVRPAPLRRYLVPGLAATALGLGYADLAAGGVTAGPVLLVLGYVVLVPLAIRVGGR